MTAMHKLLQLACWSMATCSALVAIAEPATARPNCSAALRELKGGHTDTRREYRLDRISARDLNAGESGLARLVRAKAGLRRTARPVRHLERRIPDFWRKRIPADINPADLRVSYRIDSGGLSVPKARNVADRQATLPINVRPLPPVIVCEGGSHNVVQGGVILTFLISELPASGRYNVDIETTVELP